MRRKASSSSAQISHQQQCTARTTTSVPPLFSHSGETAISFSSKQHRENDAAPNGQHSPTSASSLLRPATISKPVKDVSELPKWNYDGSSTGQAPGEDSEVIPYPQAIFKDPFRGGNNILLESQFLQTNTIKLLKFLATQKLHLKFHGNILPPCPASSDGSDQEGDENDKFDKESEGDENDKSDKESEGDENGKSDKRVRVMRSSCIYLTF
uniref:Glutamate--ammonia ligase n=1 Tax=Solanum tuberosum TaxID=4113 RepID=M1BHZ2_SOLTU